MVRLSAGGVVILVLCSWLALGSFADTAFAQRSEGPQHDVNIPVEDLDLPDREAADRAVAAAGAAAMVFSLVALAVAVLIIAAWWKVFSKAGKPGWAAIIPIYNLIVLLEICGRPLWWILLFLIPCLNIVISLIVFLDLAKSFGKGAGFGLGLWLLGIIFFPILAFGSAQYRGPAAAS